LIKLFLNRIEVQKKSILKRILSKRTKDPGFLKTFEPESTMQELFDLPEEYDQMLQKGISATGNDKNFFIQGRLNHVAKHSPDLSLVRTILDYGCGTGQSSFDLASRFPQCQILGSDLSEKAIIYAQKQFQRPNLSFVSLHEIPETTFDLIYLNGVIHHVPVKERPDVMRHLFRLAHEGTRIWIFENNPLNPGTQWAMYTNPFDKGVVKITHYQLEKLMKSAGYHVQQTDFLFYFPQWLSWFRPLEKWLKKIPLGGQYGVFARKP
jgi:ubiquinone/menaquinone biosynthesis C-methylase UbiE